jgi:hypothetical protein
MSRRRTFLSLAVAFSAALLLACSGATTPRRGEGTNPGDPQHADAATRAEREQILARARAAGVVTKTDRAGGIPRVWVEPALFGLLDYDEKEKFVGIVAAHEFDAARGEPLAAGELLLVIDAKTGKEIGHFDARGFHLE